MWRPSLWPGKAWRSVSYTPRRRRPRLAQKWLGVLAIPPDCCRVPLGDANAPTDLARVDTPTPEVKGAPQTAETLMAKAKADAGKQQVDKMLARYAETTKSASQPLPSVSPITPISVGAVKKFDASSVHAQKDTTTAPKVSVDNMNANTHIYKEPVYTKPTGQEYLNRKLPLLSRQASRPSHPLCCLQVSSNRATLAMLTRCLRSRSTPTTMRCTT